MLKSVVQVVVVTPVGAETDKFTVAVLLPAVEVSPEKKFKVMYPDAETEGCTSDVTVTFELTPVTVTPEKNWLATPPGIVTSALDSISGEPVLLVMLKVNTWAVEPVANLWS